MDVGHVGLRADVIEGQVVDTRMLVRDASMLWKLMETMTAGA
jgi:hypothetical protein